MAFSPGFKINVNKLNADEALLVLLRIDHPMFSEPVRLVLDSIDFMFNGFNYIHMPFKITRQNDVQGELPKVRLEITNVGRSLVKWVDSSGGGRDAELTVVLARRSSNIVEESIKFRIGTVNVNSDTIIFNLLIQNNLTKRAIKWIYDQNHSPGLF